MNLFKKPDCTIVFDEVPGRHRHKLIDRNDHSERFPTFFNGEDISGNIEIKLHTKSLKHKGIKAELHGIIEKYGTINKTKSFLNISKEICRPEEITKEKSYINFNFGNPKLPYESYKGDYATVKYYVKIIITATYKNAEYEKEFAVVNPSDSSILRNNDEPIQMQVGMKQKLSLSIFFQHKNYNCRGTLKGFLLFNYINIPLKFMEVQIVRREVVFGDKNCEPAYVARYELIDGVPIRNERIPIRFFLKSYNLTPSYQNVDKIFCVRYFLNLVIADEEDNRYFKQKEICLFRLYKERKNYYNNNNNYNYNNNYNNNENYNNDEIFITEPIYEEDFSSDYQPAFGGPMKNNNQNNNNNDDYYDNYNLNPNMPSINENESYDFGYNDINNFNNFNNDDRNRNRNRPNNRNGRFNDNERFNNNNFNNRNRNNTFNNNRNRNIDNNDIYNINNENNYGNKNRININNNFENNNTRNFNRNKSYNNINNDNNIINDNYNNIEENEIINDNFRRNYNNRSNNRNNRNNDNYYNDNNNYSNENNRNRINTYNQNRNKINNNINSGKNKIINNSQSNYYSIKTKNSSNSYNESDFFNNDINNNNDGDNNIINTNSNNNFSDNINNNINNNDISPLERKNNSTYRSNLMQTRISSEDDFKNIFDNLDKNVNKDELTKNIFG